MILMFVWSFHSFLLWKCQKMSKNHRKNFLTRKIHRYGIQLQLYLFYLTCIFLSVGQLLGVEMCIDNAWDDVYATLSAPESITIAEDIEQHVSQKYFAISPVSNEVYFNTSYAFNHFCIIYVIYFQSLVWVFCYTHGWVFNQTAWNH